MHERYRIAMANGCEGDPVKRESEAGRAWAAPSILLTCSANMLSQAVEDYLKAIYKLEEDTPVSTNEISATLGVAPASVTNMAKRLATLGLVRHESYRGVSLTDAGRKIALEIIRHHRLLETYLKEVMGYAWSRLHDEAEQLEHHISEDFEDKIDEMLGFPTHDPHGHPIPTREGALPSIETIPLSEMGPGRLVRVAHVSDADAALLEYLESVGLLPGSRVQVVSHEARSASVTIMLDNAPCEIAHEATTHIFVRPDH